MRNGWTIGSVDTDYVEVAVACGFVAGITIVL